ncbi:hypothetical protein J2T57_000884 [Natronocella acetinitrilica]|uniref:PepSY domain-containing protein n=1 Tax=Natronocella acetinitrilica TaxID=414046 RepID=A0AAE3G1D1_9GAMM|nr:hypothetical protein [Natronocella acetinitrilica]MCP1673785.1 hypothetical protein [Natronocella acetinitrilica]
MTFAAVVLAATLLGPVPSAFADDPLLTQDEAVELVRARTDGRILGVDTVNERQFRVRVLVRQGEVRVFRVDRVTGRVR